MFYATPMLRRSESKKEVGRWGKSQSKGGEVVKISFEAVRDGKLITGEIVGKTRKEALERLEERSRREDWKRYSFVLDSTKEGEK